MLLLPPAATGAAQVLDDDEMLSFVACQLGPGYLDYLGGPHTKQGKKDKMMDYVKLYIIPHEAGVGYNGLYTAVEEVKTAAAAAIEARARGLYASSFVEAEGDQHLTDFFRLCTVDRDCTSLLSWPGDEVRECRHEKRLLCWAWLHAGGPFSVLPQDLVIRIAQHLRGPQISEAAALKAVAYHGRKLRLRATVDPHLDVEGGVNRDFEDFPATVSDLNYMLPNRDVANGKVHFTVAELLERMHRFLKSGITRPDGMALFFAGMRQATELGTENPSAPGGPAPVFDMQEVIMYDPEEENPVEWEDDSEWEEQFIRDQLLNEKLIRERLAAETANEE